MAVNWLEEIGLRNIDLSLILIPIKMIYVKKHFFLHPHEWKTQKWCRFQLFSFTHGLVNRLTDQQSKASRQPIFLKSDSLCKMKDLLEIHYHTLSVGTHKKTPKTLFLFSLFNISCLTDLETNGLLVLIWANDTDEIKTMKKFRLSFMTASRCDFDLIKLWAELLCSILIQPRSEQQHQRHRQGRDGFSYLDVSWTCLVPSTAYCLQPFPSLSFLNHLSAPPSP